MLYIAICINVEVNLMVIKNVMMAVMLAITLIFLPIESANAEVVTVTGFGVDETSAINDAKRNAVEQVVGTVLKSISESQDMEFVMDIIKTRTQGYVNSFEIVSRKKDGDNISIKANVDVSSEPNSALMKDVELVMSLNDPRMAVVVEYYNDNDSSTLEQHKNMTKAAVREALTKSGFTHVLDSTTNAEYLIIGSLTVQKNQAIKLPDWASIGSGGAMKKNETGLSKTTASLDCKIKRAATDEIIGEFRVSEQSMSASEDDIQTQAVSKMAKQAAKEVKSILNREASKVFYQSESNL